MRKRFTSLFLVFLLAKALVAQEPPVVQVDTLVNTSEQRRGEFSVITQAQPAVVRKLPQQRIDSLKASGDYWYADREPQKKKQKARREEPLMGEGVRSLLWILILCAFIGVVVWYLASSNVFLFRKRAKKVFEESGEEEIGEDIYTLAYEKEIDRAAAAGNYRLAVRLWYLKTLKELSERGIIAYRSDRSNSEYLFSLYNTRYYQQFFRLTRHFEYAWYGGFPLSAETYAGLRTEFQTFLNSIAA